MVESQPSKLLVAGSIPVSRSRSYSDMQSSDEANSCLDGSYSSLLTRHWSLFLAGRCSSVGRARPW